MTDRIDYGQLMHKAMQGVLYDVLSEVAENGLPGKHHFFITFDTTHSGVDMSDALRQRFPGDMTIVMQDWFENLAVMPDRFIVTLNFGNVPEPMVIPFDAVKTFVDPSVEFGLRLDNTGGEDVGGSTGIQEVSEESPDEEPDEEAAPDKDAEIVSLDSFRKP